MKKALRLRWIVVAGISTLLALAAACSAEPEIVEVEKEVVVKEEVVREVQVEVVVEKEVVREVPVETVMIKEVPVEKIVEKVVEVEREVVKEVPVEVVVEKEVVKTVEVEKPVIVRQEVVKEVVKEVRVEVPVEKVVVKEVEKVVVATAVPMAPVGWLLRAPEPNPTRGGQVRTAWRTFTSNNDIHQGGQENILTNFYNNLIRFNPADGLRTISPDLAESWEIAADGNSYTFKLREGVNYTDGTPFGAEDVVATFNRIIFPPEGIVSVRKSRYDAIGKVEATGPYEVRFTLTKPRVWQFEVLNGPDAVIYSKKSLEENNNDLRKVIAPGTGPFRFVERQIDEFWLFEANPDHWNPNLPYVDQAKMLNIFGWSDRGIAVLTGIADFSWNAAPDTLVEARKRPDVHTSTPYIFASVGIAMNAEKPPFTDPRVRRAIHLALNRHNLVAVYRTALDLAHVSRWMSPGSTCAQSNDEVYSIPGYRVDNTEDIAEAQRLLAVAGFPNGEGLRTLEQVNHTQAAHLGVLAPAFNEQLKTNLNIDVTIRAVEVAVLPEVYRGDYDFVAWGTPVNPIRDITPLWEGNWKTGGSQNHGNYSNADFDAVVDQLSVELDPIKRCELYRRGQDILDNDPPQFLWGFTSHGTIWGDHVHGLSLDQRVMSEWGRFDTVWLDQ